MVERERPDGPRVHARLPLLAAVALVAGTVGFTGSSAADVSSVGGGAFGASVDVALLGATPTIAEPVPSVTLPSSGDRVTDSVPSLSVTGEDASAPFGGRLLQTGTLMVNSHGTTGPAGSSTSTASLGDVDAFDSFLTATEVVSTCTSSESGAVASTTLTDASRVGNETERVALPTDPGPNTIVNGSLPGSDDVVTLILNEQQVVNGSMVVNAVRIVVDGPSAAGEIVLAQSRCATVAAVSNPPAPTEPTDEPVAEPVDPVIEPVEPVEPVEPAEPVNDPADGTVTEPVDEPVTQAVALPAEGPTERLAASTVEPPTVPARLRTGPAENVQPDTRGTAQLLAAALPAGGPGLFAAQVSEVTGGAFGYLAEIALFGAAQPKAGPEPTVSLPPTGGDESRTAPSAEVVFGGVATFFTSGPLEVTTQGTTGPTGSVTSTASIQNVNTSGDEVFTAANLSSTCTASESGGSGSATITGGTVRTHAQAEDHPEGVVNIPTNPPPGHTVEGHLHIGATQDEFRYIFNEQIRNADGSITVNAARMELLGPNATGDLVIGQSRCGVNPGGGAGGAGGRLGVGSTDGAGDAVGNSGAGGRSGSGGRSGTGGRAGSSGRRLADTGGETPTLLAAALMLAAFTMRRRVRPRPAAGPDGQP